MKAHPPARDANTVEPQALQAMIERGGELALVDVREAGEFGEGHLLTASSVPYSLLELEIAARVPRRDAPVVVIDGGDGVAARAARRLAGLGYTDVAVLAGGVPAWAEAGLPLFVGVNVPTKAFGELVEAAKGTPHIAPAALAAMRAEGKAPVVLDGRTVDEHRRMCVPGAIAVPNGELVLRFRDLVQNDATPVVVHCAGRTRSIIGAQTLINAGVRNPVYALENGTMGWRMAGFELAHGDGATFGPVSPAAAEWASGQAAALRQRYGVRVAGEADLACFGAERGRTTYLLDVRTPEEFAAGHLPGSQHAPGGQLVQAADEWCAVHGARLVLVDGGDLVRATTAAHWLVQLGWETWVLEGGTGARACVTGAAAPSLSAGVAERVRWIEPSVLAASLGSGGPLVVDVGPSAAFQQARIPGAVWATRARLARLAGPAAERPSVVLSSPDGLGAALAAVDLAELVPVPVAVLRGGRAAWVEAGLPMDDAPVELPREERIDYLFWAHDRHQGNDEAAKTYLAWEHSLVAAVAGRRECPFDIR